MPDATRPQRLLALAVHELRTPANVIGGSLRLLRTLDDRADERRAHALGLAERSFDRLVELLAQMSELWRLEAGEAVSHRYPTAVGTILERAVQAFGARSDSPATRVNVSEVAALRVVADQGRLVRALDSLMLATARQLPVGVSLCISGARYDAEGSARVRLVMHGEAHQPPPEAPLGEIDEFQSGLGLLLPLAHGAIRSEGGSVHAPAGGPSPAFVVVLPAQV